MLKIIHVNLAKGYRGGERQTSLLIKQLASNAKISQQLVCRVDSPMRQDLKGTANLTFIHAQNQLQGHFSTQQSDIVHAHEAKAVHWAWLHKIIRKTPYILTRRIEIPVKNKWLNQQTYSNAAHLVGISSKVENTLKTIQANNTSLIPSAMAKMKANDDITNAFKKTFPDKFLIGHIGALVDKTKGQRIIIEAARQLEKSHPAFQFLLFGNGIDKEELAKESAELSNISWMGFKKNVGDYIAAFDLFIFPSRNEGLGSTLLDVMHANVPIIASKVGGIPDIVIDDETGVLLKENTAHKLQQAILNLYKDEEKIKRLCSNARNSLARYTPEKMSASYETLYRKVIQD